MIPPFAKYGILSRLNPIVWPPIPGTQSGTSKLMELIASITKLTAVITAFIIPLQIFSKSAKRAAKLSNKLI